jgi:2-C-methyl-D-erythritol 4-phosphate cytidylyltransferase
MRVMESGVTEQGATNKGETQPGPDSVGVIIVSAGASSRMAGVDKTTVNLAGRPLIARTVEAFERSSAVGAIVLVVARDNLSEIADIARNEGWEKVVQVRIGGVRRQDSVSLGLKALPDCDWVIVHDGARPLVTEKVIEDGLLTAKAVGAAVAGVPVVDTIKVVTDDGHVVETLDRRTLAIIQTPQIFRRDLLEAAHAEPGEDFTDDASMLEASGVPVEIFMGDRANIKVTTREDLIVAEAVIAEREARA